MLWDEKIDAYNSLLLTKIDNNKTYNGVLQHIVRETKSGLSLFLLSELIYIEE